MINEFQIIYLALITAFAMLAEALRDNKVSSTIALVWCVIFIINFIESFF